MFCRDGREHHATDTAVDQFIVSRSRERTTAIDRNPITCIHQALGELLGECLKASVAIGYAARAQNRNVQRLTVGRGQFAKIFVCWATSTYNIFRIPKENRN